MRRGRKVVTFAALLLLAVVGAVLGYFLLTMNGRIERLIEQSASEYLGVPVTVGSVNVSPLRGRAVLRDLNVPNPEGFATPRAFRIRYASVSFDILSAFDDVIDLPEIQVSGLEVTVEGSVKGTNISKLVANAKRVVGEKERAREAAGERPEPATLFHVGRVVLTDTTINLSATFMEGRAASYPIPRIEVTGLPPEATPGDILGRVIEAALSESAKAPGAIGRLLGELTVNAGIGVVGSTLETAKEVGKGALEGAGGIAQGIGSGFGEASRGVGAGIGDGIVGVADGVGEIGRGLLSGVGGTVEGVGRGAGEAIRRVGVGIGAVGRGLLEGAAEIVKGLGNGAVNGVRIVGEIGRCDRDEGVGAGRGQAAPGADSAGTRGATTGGAGDARSEPEPEPEPQAPAST